MVLVVENKKLKGVWWKYGLALAVVQMLAWVGSGLYIYYPDVTVFSIFRDTASYIYGGFVIFAFLPFAFARAGLRRLMWCALIGFALGDAAYFILRSYAPTRSIILLPFMAFSQICVALISLGIVLEFGAYVYKKVFEE